MSLLQIGQGHVFHRRQGRIENQFRYPSFFFLFSCAEENTLRDYLKRGAWHFFSLRNEDYLEGKSGPLLESARSFLKNNCQYDASDIWLQTLPRMFGYAFNPVNFWICRKDGKMDAVLCEVNNTFGERHFYWIPNVSGPEQWHESQKVFHVSPFYPVEGKYRFRFKVEKTLSKIDIFYHGPEGELRLSTWIEGQLRDVVDIRPVKLFFQYGWMTPLVVFRIHYQAFRLWIKKARFYSKPEPPTKKVT